MPVSANPKSSSDTHADAMALCCTIRNALSMRIWSLQVSTKSQAHS